MENKFILQVSLLLMLQALLMALCNLSPQFAAIAKNQDYLILGDRNLLLTPGQDTICDTGESKVIIGSHSTIYIVNNTYETIVFDLSQTAPNKIFVLIDNAKLAMCPGKVLFIERQQNINFKHLQNDYLGVKYYNPQFIEISKRRMQVLIADFKISSAIAHIDSLKELTRSNNGQDKLTMDKIYRAAVLSKRESVHLNRNENHLATARLPQEYFLPATIQICNR